MKRRIMIRIEKSGLEHTGEMSYGYGQYVNGYGPAFPQDEDCPIALVAGECLSYPATDAQIDAAKKRVYSRVRRWQDRCLAG